VASTLPLREPSLPVVPLASSCALGSCFQAVGMLLLLLLLLLPPLLLLLLLEGAAGLLCQ
jgi:hypothetical protein